MKCYEEHINHVITYRECDVTHCPATKIRKMVDYIDSAKLSLDICLYLLTNKTLGDALFRAYKRGLHIRIITDGDMLFASGSQYLRLIKKNVKILCTPPPFIMHEKFVIIDKKILLEGSMNWTSQACSGNSEHISIVGFSHMVSEFQKHFDDFFSELERTQNQQIQNVKQKELQIKKSLNWDT